MAIVLDLPSDLENKARNRAVRRGQDLETFLLELLQAQLGEAALSQNGVEDEDERPWRGLFLAPSEPALAYPPIIPIEVLPKQEHTPNMNWHRIHDDDE